MYTPNSENQSNQKFEPELTYNNIVNEAKRAAKQNNHIDNYSLQGNNYKSSFVGNDDFIYVKQNTTRSYEANGLKFHVSVDPRRMSEAWDIILETMAKHDVPEAKFANPLLNKTQEPGKEITIYAFRDPDRPMLKSQEKPSKQTSWETVIQEISERLQSAGIQPGAAATSNSQGGGMEHTIKGTNYITWRNDHPNLDGVITTLPSESIPQIIDESKIEKFFVDNKLKINNESDIEWRNGNFRYYHECINDMNALGNQLALNKTNTSGELQRLSDMEHATYRAEEYKKIQETPVTDKPSIEVKTDPRRKAGNWEDWEKSKEISRPTPPPRPVRSAPSSEKTIENNTILNPPEKVAMPIQKSRPIPPPRPEKTLITSENKNIPDLKPPGKLATPIQKLAPTPTSKITAPQQAPTSIVKTMTSSLEERGFVPKTPKMFDAKNKPVNSPNSPLNASTKPTPPPRPVVITNQSTTTPITPTQSQTAITNQPHQTNVFRS